MNGKYPGARLPRNAVGIECRLPVNLAERMFRVEHRKAIIVGR